MLKPLPYAYDALEPIISARTISFHYEKHHAGYVSKLISLLPEEDKELSLSQILSKYDGVIWNNAAQHHHHEFYWNSLTPSVNQTIPDALANLVAESFGHMDAFLEQFHTKCVGLFGSGWVWLTFENGKLYIEATSNADFPQRKPLFVLDVWEHAYYLDYQNNRSGHIKAVLEYINWEQVYQRLWSV